MTAAVLTPFASSAGQAAGANRWRKLLIPVGTINYQGQKINFDRPYLDSLVAAFRNRAYGQVPFQLANDDNAHTNDPERFRGEITNMMVDHQGLWVDVETTPRGSKVLRDNPKLGVSARIVEDFARADGMFYPQAVQHVLGTLDPRITGTVTMGGWTAIEAANSGETSLIDLTTGTWEPQNQEGLMPDLPQDAQARLARLLSIPDAQFDQLLTGLGAGGASPPAPAPAAPPAPAPAGGQGDQGDDLEDVIAWIDSLSPEQVAQLEADLDDDNFDIDALLGEPAGAGADLSNDYGLGYGQDGGYNMAVELANARASRAESRLGTLEARLSEADFAAERRRLVQDFGIAPFLVDLARPLLQGAGHTIELANGQSVDAGQIVRTLLAEGGKAGALRTVDLSGPVGQGGGIPEDAAAEQQAAATRTDIVNRYKNQVGGTVFPRG